MLRIWNPTIILCGFSYIKSVGNKCDFFVFLNILYVLFFLLMKSEYVSVFFVLLLSKSQLQDGKLRSDGRLVGRLVGRQQKKINA